MPGGWKRADCWCWEEEGLAKQPEPGPGNAASFAPAGAEAAAAELNNSLLLEEKEAAYMVTPGTPRAVSCWLRPLPLLVARNPAEKVLYSTLGLEDPPFNNAATLKPSGNIFSAAIPTSWPPPRSSLTIWQITDLLNYLTMGSSRKLEFSPKIALWLLIYILLVGPATYFLLKKAKRWEWAWATIPSWP